jgi:hypothetical protein
MVYDQPTRKMSESGFMEMMRRKAETVQDLEAKLKMARDAAVFLEMLETRQASPEAVMGQWFQDYGLEEASATSRPVSERSKRAKLKRERDRASDERVAERMRCYNDK